MNELQKQFDNKCIMIPIQKVYKEFRVQQKSLKDVNERVRNANATFIVPTQDTHYKKVLVIDDFTGSGATLNVLAGMLKRQHIATQVDGLTITGSMNGFEIIKEV
jgi:predicted amidophosphoribosyltransferase